MSTQSQDVGENVGQAGSPAIARCAPGDERELIAFRTAVHGPQTIFADAGYFRWMYCDPHTSSSDRMTCWVYRAAERIEGQIGGFPVVLKVGETETPALWALDGAVSTDHRGKGVLEALLDSIGQEREVEMATEVTPGGRRVMLRKGWVDIGTLPLFIRPLDIGAILTKRAGRLGGFIGQAIGLLGRGLELQALAAAARDGLALEQIASFDASADRIWEQASPSYPVICRRDSAYLNWRFARFPKERYRFFYLVRSASEPVGYCVLRAGARYGLRAGYIVDFLCAPRWTRPLVALCLQHFRREGMAAVCCIHRNPVSSTPFISLGFLPRSTSWQCVLRTRDPAASAFALAKDSGKWFLTAGDSDLDRPRPEDSVNP